MEEWKYRLKKLIRNITERETWAFDPDARHHRIEGQFGGDVRVFDPTLMNLFLCFNITEEVDLIKDYGEAVSFIDNMFRGVGRKFKRVHLNLWANNYYLEQPRNLRRLVLLSKLEECYQNGLAKVGKSRALASSILKPFVKNEEGSMRRPDLMVVFTRGHIENDLDKVLQMKYSRLRKETIWICAANNSDIAKSAIYAIDPLVEKRLVQLDQ